MNKYFYLALLLPGLLVASCGEDDKDGGDEQGATAQLGVEVKDAQDVFEVSQHQSVTLNLAVTAKPVPSEAYTITLGANPGLVSTYNAAYGTAYQMLPSEAFTFTSTQVMLPRYSAKSTCCELRLKGEGCVEDQVYLLPVVIDGVQGGTNFQAPDEMAAYILFKVGAAQQEGNGSEAAPYVVDSTDSFLQIGSLLRDDETTYFKLGADIDFKDVVFNEENPWTPINYAADDDAKSAARKRRIVLDGNKHKISNFTAGGPLFGTLCGSVQNLTVENAKIDCETDDGAVIIGVGGASGDPESLIMRNVVVKNSSVVNDYKRSGALIAHLRCGTVENCEASCSVTAQQQGGGLIGRMDGGTITNCAASGDVTSEAYYNGGLIGYLGDVTVTNCHASGNVTSLNGNYTRAGGLIGQIEGNATIEKCYATGNVEGVGHMAGGLIGVVGADEITVTISKCYATGNVTLPHGDSGNWAHAGGLLGTIAAKGESTPPTVMIDNCYATGAIAVRRYSSGFVGTIYSKPAVLKISNSYTISDISGIVVADRCGVLIGAADAMDKGTSVTCKGFVAWNVSDRPFSYNDCVPVEGNYYGTDGTVSAQASKLGWDSSVWDLSGDLPKLK